MGPQNKLLGENILQIGSKSYGMYLTNEFLQSIVESMYLYQIRRKSVKVATLREHIAYVKL